MKMKANFTNMCSILLYSYLIRYILDRMNRYINTGNAMNFSRYYFGKFTLQKVKNNAK